jgi:hypothetical protein
MINYESERFNFVAHISRLSISKKKTVCTINLIEFLNKLTLGFYHSEPSKTVCNIKDTISLFFRHIQMSRS